MPNATACFRLCLWVSDQPIEFVALLIPEKAGADYAADPDAGAAETWNLI
jgi:hypothetical protein